MAAIVVAASASLATAEPYYSSSGCGCLEKKIVRLQPVREMVVERRLYTVERPLPVGESTCLMEPRTTVDWGAPFRTVGHVVSAPFIALGNAFSPSEQVIEPVGERFNTVTTYSTVTYRHKKHLTKWNEPMLMPVGERFTTVKIIRHKKMLEPVGERFTTVKVIHHKRFLEPVGERTIIVRKTQILEPVGERIITRRYVSPWSSCY